MKLFLFFGLGILLFLFSSCHKYEPAKPAFFLTATSVKVATVSGQGSGSHKITDLWIYVNGKFQGAYPVGNMMPVVNNNQKASIEVFAGIKNNGISTSRNSYPIYQILKFDTLIESGQHIERGFTFAYKSIAVFPLVEGFEESTKNFSLQAAPDSDTTFYVAKAEDAFEGKSIQMGLTGRSRVGKLISIVSYSLPLSNGDVYMEVNFKGNKEIEVGLIGDNGAEKSILMMAPSSEWNKIYIQLSTAINSDPISTKHKIYFKILNNENFDPVMFLDNIKLVYI